MSIFEKYSLSAPPISPDVSCPVNSSVLFAQDDGPPNSTDDDYEYATLPCQWSSSSSAAETVVTAHLKVAFCGGADGTAMRACAAIAGGGGTEADRPSGLYAGTVTADEAAAAAAGRSSADQSAVDAWTRDARAALTADDAAAGEYVRCLRDEGSGEVVVLSWRIKVAAFCAVTLGTVRMNRVQGPVARMCAEFVEPLMRGLRAERLRGERAGRAAAATESLLADDNRRLLDRLRGVAESRRRDDDRLMARFLAVLNAKKRRLETVQNELSRLKGERGSAGGQPPDDRTATERKRRRRNGRDAPGKRAADEGSPTKPVTVPGGVPEEEPASQNPFDAPTQIDEPTTEVDSLSREPSSSPPWLQQEQQAQSTITTTSSPANKKSVLDSLWEGII